MTEAEIRKQVCEALHQIAPECDLEGLDPNKNLREALEIDSFDFLNFIISLHRRFGVNIPESDYAKVSTLNRIVAYLRTIPS